MYEPEGCSSCGFRRPCNFPVEYHGLTGGVEAHVEAGNRIPVADGSSGFSSSFGTDTGWTSISESMDDSSRFPTRECCFSLRFRNVPDFSLEAVSDASSSAPYIYGYSKRDISTARRRASLLHLNVGPRFGSLSNDFTPNVRVSSAHSPKQEESRRSLF
ncbi:hypothetical protein SCHPADRAFT_393918 [Schizopora paradoxa]|uniref:Uncharacterized protein n=1 Tax=Schizopora paradoxa TaxID=27342 RepID=A0A0H2RLM8_9AGAM|nr:hypothetical protein SCHPADRAFT_393918 [Schizopora paradoxa]